MGPRNTWAPGSACRPKHSLTTAVQFFPLFWLFFLTEINLGVSPVDECS